jgi:hypothetical protein
MEPSESPRPEKLLEYLGISTPEEIDVEAIAAFCGATVRYDALKSSEARVIGFGDKAFITVNRSSTRGRERFSVGHELAHWLKDRGRVAFECDAKAMNGEWTGISRERLANRYAADLLLPLSMFVPRTRNRPITFGTAEELASTFETSLTATAIRLVENGPLPAMAVCWSTDGRRKWFIRGRDVPDSIWPPEKPGRHALVSGLLGGSSPDGPEEVCAAEWTTRNDADRYVVVEDSRRISADFVLSLVWWKDERQLLDLDSDSD